MIPTLARSAARPATNGTAGAPPRTPSHPAAHPNPASKEKTVTVTVTPFNLTAADLEGEYDGIAVCVSSEDGDMIALGHHDAAAALAAFNRHAVEYLGLANVLDEDALPAEELADLVDCITHQWGVARKATAEQEASEGWTWVLDPAGKDAPGAIAYTYLGLD